MPIRWTVLAIVALVACGGCRSFNAGGLRKDDLPDLSRSSTVDLEPVVVRHNANASRVESLKASDLSVNVTTYNSNGRDRRLLFSGGTQGYLLLERPQKLRMVLRKPMVGELVDLGSNDAGFWFSNAQAKEIVVGRYDDSATNPLVASIQPEWIVDVLGLRTYDPASLKLQRTDEGVLATETRNVAGERLTKETVFEPRTGQVLRHRLYDGKRKVVAEATVRGGYQTVAMGTGESAQKVELPRTVELKIAQTATMTITLDGLQLNPDRIDPENFVQPDKERDGYVRLDVREVAGGQGESFAAAGSADESRPRMSRQRPATVAANGGVSDPAVRQTSPRPSVPGDIAVSGSAGGVPETVVMPAIPQAAAIERRSTLPTPSVGRIPSEYLPH